MTTGKAIGIFVAVICALGTQAAAQSVGGANRSAGAGNVIVHPQFGGTIFGFDIDPRGGVGILSEGAGQPDGTVLAAVETFDPATGKILRVVRQTQTQDDFVTLGITGNSLGIIEREHVVSLFNVIRTYQLVNTIGTGKLPGPWTPPLDHAHVINEVSRAYASPSVAVYALDTSTNFTPLIFSSNVAANTFGTPFPVLDTDFNFEQSPVIAYDNMRNRAVLGHQKNSQFIVPPMVGVMDLTTGTFTKFPGLGLGVINGIAVDPQDGIACTDTSFDSSIQFYSLTTKKGTSVPVPGDPQDSLFAGQHIVYDSLNKLFLVAQPFSSVTATGSSILVYDTAGNFVESVDGLSFNGESNVLPVHIAINPSLRSGFVDGPAIDDTEIQSFTY
ncbi:MAG TPA: hypothetical protein VGG04_04665 [Candidatus Sulfotelmatobacter sp.]|jgi:hypothetical protein